MFKYEFDFSKQENINEIDDKNSIIGQFIAEAVKEMKNDTKPKTVTPEDKKKFLKIQNNLFYIAKENHAKMAIINKDTHSRIHIEIEADVLDCNTQKLKKLFVASISLSRFINIENRKNGKFAIVVEVDVFANQ